jgi:glycosyltransferase involved in cell wall biosynthesis
MQGQVVYNAINPNRFPKKNEEGLVNAIMVANFTDYKDHATFIRAAIVLLEKGVLDHVYLVGDGPTRSKHQESIAKYAATTISKIHFQGAINNVEEILSNCRYGILCSTVTYSEGVSNAILEYMAAGLIPIATNVGGTPEIIKNGRNGYLTGAGNHEQIVNIIADLEKDPRQRSKIVTEAKQTIVEKFSYEGNVEKLINFYKQICRKN